MADDFAASIGGATKTFAADEVGGKLFQRIKPTFGLDGTATDVSDANPLPVAMDGTATIGTRAYGVPLTRVAVGGSSTQSAITSASEVLLHASTRCFVLAGSNPTATINSIPLEAGEKFHMRITPGHRVAVLRDTADGFLNIVPVA